MSGNWWLSVERPEPTIKLRHKGEGYTILTQSEARKLFHELGDTLADLGVFGRPQGGWTASFSGRVTDAGGGQVSVLVDRDTENYPKVGDRVRVKVEAPDGAS